MTTQEVYGLAPLLALLGLVVLVGWAVWWLVRYALADPMTRDSIRQAVRVRAGWKRLAPMLQLVRHGQDADLARVAVEHRQQAHQTPRPGPGAQGQTGRFGVLARANCLPGVGLEQFQKAAPYLANAWRCTRVSVTQDGPGKSSSGACALDPLSHRPCTSHARCAGGDGPVGSRGGRVRPAGVAWTSPRCPASPLPACPASGRPA